MSLCFSKSIEPHMFQNKSQFSFYSMFQERKYVYDNSYLPKQIVFQTFFIHVKSSDVLHGEYTFSAGKYIFIQNPINKKKQYSLINNMEQCIFFIFQQFFGWMTAFFKVK